jgi:cation transport ATPase
MFTPFTLAACTVAFVLSHDWERVLAVLAIATPCPLILAAPVAILGGFNRAARRQILIRNGGALEALGSISAVLFDKTGTVTIGRPQVARVVATDARPSLEILRLASGVEQGSGHLLARTLIADAESRGLKIPLAMSVVETAGRGVEGEVDSLHITVGAGSFVRERNPGARAAIESADAAVMEDNESPLRAYIAINGSMAGFVEYDDKLRPGVRALVQRLREDGVSHVILLSGDRTPNVKAIAAAAGITEFYGDMLPENKVEVVKRLLGDGESVAMIGDGTNDAPALGAATVGVALASHGRGIATEAADVILLADDPARIIDCIDISRRTMRIARQSIWAGLGLSAAGMIAALFGHIVPVVGAGIQELVDLAVILNALRASRDATYGKHRTNLVAFPTEPMVVPL